MLHELNIRKSDKVDIKCVNGKVVVAIRNNAQGVHPSSIVQREEQIPIQNEELEEASKMDMDSLEESHRYISLYIYISATTIWKHDDLLI